ncbi:MAG: hypothetical protein ACJ78U_00085 [Myxococcales bacterium]
MLERLVERKAGRFNRILGVALVASLLAGVAWSVGPSFLPDPPSAPPSWRAPWSGPGPEPQARAWAAPLEPSLTTACADALRGLRDPRPALWGIAQQLPKGEALTPDENQEVKAVLSDSAGFARPCLAAAYRAIAPCSAHQADLSNAAARACLVPATTRALAAVPYELCQERAKSERLRHACGAAAAQARQHADEFVRTNARL